MIKRLLLTVVAGAAVIGSAWAVPAYAHAHQSLNDCYYSTTEGPQPHLDERARLTRLPPEYGVGSDWRICVHHLATDD